LDHPIRRRQKDVSAVGQLLRWFRRRVGGGESGSDRRESDQVVTSTGRLHPGEDETSGEFADRVARIKADVLQRALAAIEAARNEEEPTEADVGSDVPVAP
jgi:hypothetical protein